MTSGTEAAGRDCAAKEANGKEANGKEANGEVSRVSRLLRIVHSIRENPHQSLAELTSSLGIGRSQFYKDRTDLMQVGFCFEYRAATGFQITEDRLTPLIDLSISDRLVLMFALEQLSSTGDGTLAAMAMDAGRKLAGGLPSPFKEKLLDCFDSQVTGNFGARQDILSRLRDALLSGERIRILYTRAETWDKCWRMIDPRHIYIRQKALYLYARTRDEVPPQWKVFRLSRIEAIQGTGLHITWPLNEDDGFRERMKNAFDAFIGINPRPITIRFTGQASHYVRERMWHSSQKLEEDGKGGLLFTVTVAEPEEVVRWSRQFGDEASIVSMPDDEAK